MRRPHTVMLVFAAACLAWAGVASAQAPKALLNRDEMLAAAKEVTRKDYPNAEEVCVARARSITYQAAGTYVQWHEEYVKILTEKSRRQHKLLSTYFTIPYQQEEDCTIPLAEIIKPDGRVVTIDAQGRSKVVSNTSSMSANIYTPNQRIRRVPLADLEVGDVLHFEMYDRIVHPRMKNTFNDWFALESTEPILFEEITVIGPKSMPLRSIVIKNEVPGTVKTFPPVEEGDTIRYRWELRDVPRLFEEPGMPPMRQVLQRLLVSTSPDWPHVSRWYWDVAAPHLAPTDAMKRKVAELTEGLADPLDTIEAIFQYVAKEIRYLGIVMESESPGYEPHDVAITFEKKHGVCRDKAALLVAMLRLAGFDAFPVLIDTGAKKDVEVPQPYFNHAIACVRQADGSYLLMDPTDDTTTELLPAYLNDKSFLVAAPEGEQLRTSPIVPAEKNLLLVETDGHVDDAGMLAAHTVIRFEGANDNFLRGYLARLTPSDQRRVFEGVLRSAAPGARLTTIEITPEDMRDTTRTLSVAVSYQVPDALVRGEEVSMLPILRLGSRLGMVGYILSGMELEKRRYPMKTMVACGVRERFRIHLPDAFARIVSLPAYEAIDDGRVLWKQTVTAHGNELVGQSDFRLKVVEFSPEEYLSLKENLKKIEYESKRMPILARKGAPGSDGENAVDAIVLDEAVEYDLSDAHNWTVTRSVRKKILTPAGIKRYAEIKAHYNPVWEEVTLEKGAVTSASGEVREIDRDKEINELDAPWAGQAPRYPTGRIKIMSLPGVEVGATIEYRVKSVLKERPMFAMSESFRGQEPIRKKTVRLVAPADVAVTAFVLEGLDAEGRVVRHEGSTDTVAQTRAVAETRGEADGRVTWTWTAVDQDRVEREVNLPPWYSFNPTVSASAGDWRAYAAEVHRALKAAATNQGDAADEVKRIAADTGDDVDALLERVRDLVATRVTKAGPSLPALPLSAVTPADTTLADGYGNNTDRAVLLYAMLDAAGLAPEFVLGSWAPMVPALQPPLVDAPDSDLFEDVLVRVRRNGDNIFLNDTNQYDQVGTTHHDGRLGLFLPEGGIDTIRAPDPLRDRSEIEYLIQLESDGHARITRTRRFFGTDFGREKKFFDELPPEKRRRYFLKLVTAISKAAKAEGDLVTDFARYPAIESFTARVDRFAVRDERHLYLKLPVSLSALFRLRATDRRNPFYVALPHRILNTTVVVLPEDLRVPLLAPKAGQWHAPNDAGTVVTQCRLLTPDDLGGDDAPEEASIKETLERGDHVFQVVQTVDIRPAVFSAEEYNNIRDQDSRLDHLGAVLLLLGEAVPVEAAK